MSKGATVHVAAISCVCHASWLLNLMNELHMPQEDIAEIFVDYKLALALMKNLIYHNQNKHIYARKHFIRKLYRFIRELRQENLQLKHARSKKSNYDTLTTRSKQETFEKLRMMLKVT